ncbi:carbohydrate ABC transporter permease [Phytomonospora sp. NPDC050363]|uniref:carbohydrate ABC transporter permease n=1 Tax=Phytomonospora sp. NPDC050363 TaxID=3155642 RepID=UPI0033CD9067
MTGAARSRPNLLAGALTAAWLVVVAVPILAMISWSLQSQQDLLDHGPLAPPTDVTFENFAAVFDMGFAGYMGNTLMVTAAVIVLTLLLSIPAAYAVVRSRSLLASASFRVFLLGLAIPAQAVIIPVYLIITKMGLNDTLAAVVLPTVAFNLPLVVLILSGSLRDISGELYDAMTVDGAGSLRMMLSLVLPLSRGSITTVSVFVGLGAWNSFIFPLIFLHSPDKKVLTLGLQSFRQEFGINLPGMMMGVLLSALPIFVLYLFARRWLVAGLAGVGGK